MLSAQYLYHTPYYHIVLLRTDTIAVCPDQLQTNHSCCMSTRLSPHTARWFPRRTRWYSKPCAGADPNGAKVGERCQDTSSPSCDDADVTCEQFRKLFAHIAVATGIWQRARRPQFAIACNLVKHGANPTGTGAVHCNAH